MTIVIGNTTGVYVLLIFPAPVINKEYFSK